MKSKIFIMLVLIFLTKNLSLFANESEKKSTIFFSFNLGIPYMIFQDGLDFIDSEDTKFIVSGSLNVEKLISGKLLIGLSYDIFFHYSFYRGYSGTGIASNLLSIEGKYYILKVLEGFYLNGKIGLSLFQTCRTSNIGYGFQIGSGYSIPMDNYSFDIGLNYSYLRTKETNYNLISQIINIYFGISI